MASKPDSLVTISKLYGVSNLVATFKLSLLSSATNTFYSFKSITSKFELLLSSSEIVGFFTIF